jgi:hypothetical protein
VESNLVFAYAYDRLVEEPYWRGVATSLQRPYGEQGFLSRQMNNVDEHVFLLLYDNPRFLAGRPGLRRWQEKTFTAGAYLVYRRQDAEKGIVRVFDGTRYQAYDCADASPPPACGARSRVVIIDPYVKLRLGPLLVEAEGYVIFGSVEKGKGIPIGNEVGKVLLHGWATRLGYRLPRGFEVLLDLGQAEGDASLPDETFRQKAFHPDYGVGLALYREFLRERTATALAQRLNANVAGTLEPARGLQSNGGVMNSVFLFPRVRWQVNRHLMLKLALVAAWADVQDGEFLFRKGTCAKGDLRCRIKDRYLGTEIDVGLDLAWGFRDGQPHLLFRLDMGYLVFGSQVSADYDAPGMFALRTRLMMVF